MLTDLDTGIDSPVIKDSSVIEIPSTTCPSTGILLPGTTFSKWGWQIWSLLILDLLTWTIFDKNVQIPSQSDNVYKNVGFANYFSFQKK